ncbi:MAG: hypothetical protein DRJ50_01610 [Actinobacteria bacterium]|nr:MAG: hypothetical protein DRJ50_01610 [Actinomycetota bacterium]
MLATHGAETAVDKLRNHQQGMSVVLVISVDVGPIPWEGEIGRFGVLVCENTELDHPSVVRRD